MNLQDRNLSQGSDGDDVKLLQSELRQLGHVIADGEVAKNVFGETTLRAVLDFQKSHGLTADGIVKVNTAKELSIAIESLPDPNNGEPKTTKPKRSEIPAPSDSTQLSPKGAPKAPAPPIPFVIQGQILQTDSQPAIGLQVYAFDKDKDGKEILLGESMSDQDGRYKISYAAELFLKLRGERDGLDMVLRVSDQTHNMRQGWNAVHITKPVETVNPKPPVSWLPWKDLEKKPFSVSGKVLWSDGKPAGDLSVRAFDKDLRSEEELGQSVTDKHGNYRINYSAWQFRRNEKGSADLRVAVFSEGGRELVSSEIHFNAGPEMTVDLKAGPDPTALSEYERYLADLAPLLQGVTLIEIANETAADQDKDLDFLTGDTGIDRQHLAWLVRAAWLEHETRLLPVVFRAGGIPAVAFYGWFREGLPIDWEELRLQPISRLRTALVDVIDKNVIPSKLREDAEKILARVPNPEIAELANLLRISTLSEDKMRSVLTHADGIEGVTDQVLAKLVEQNVLAAPEAQFVGLSVSLHRLTAGDQSLVSTMLDSNFVSLGGRKLKQARDLASLESDDWERVLEGSDSPVPEGMPRVEYARSLAMDAASEFPHAAFVQRAMNVPEAIPARLNTIQPLLEKNATAITLDFDKLDLAGVSNSERERLRAAHTDLKRFANSHPGLDLHTVLSKQESVSTTVKLVNERVGWLRTVFELNKDVDFLNLDYLPNSTDLSEVQFGDLSKDARELVVKDLKAHQRIYTVTDNAIPAREIMQAGFYSASAIALTPVSDFVDKSGLPEAEARAYFDNARERGNEAATNYFRFYDLVRDQLTTQIRSIPSRTEPLMPLAGVQELIHSQPWCECAHCQSMLSPGAYFVDLMYYIEENILNGSFQGKERHRLNLKVRRSDLWKLELTCKNTDEYVPYLDVVNKILESHLKDVLPELKQLVPPADADDLYEHLSRQAGSFKQPFTLPMERLEILLKHFGLSRYDVANAMGSDKQRQARARLKMSKQEYDLVTSERTAIEDLRFFKQLFKLPDEIEISSSDTLFKPIEMQTLLNATGLAHTIVASVLSTKFVNFDQAAIATIAVVLGKRAPADVQHNSELVNHLTLKRLDRIHRFVRLWRKLPWTIEELDYVLGRLKTQRLANGIDDNALIRILNLLNLNAKWSLPIDELMALCDAFPEKDLRQSTSLFDRLFNQQPFLDRDGTWPPNPIIRFTHPAWASNPHGGVSRPDNNTVSRLLAGLQLEDKELVELLASLSSIPAIGHLPADPATSRDKSIELSVGSIVILYRHARLKRLLMRSMADFVKLVSLTPRIAQRNADQRYIRDLADVTSVIEFAASQEKSGFTLEEISYITGGARPEGSTDPGSLASEIITRVQTDRSLEFADTVFTEIGVTDIQSRQIVSNNVSKDPLDNKPFEVLPLGGSYRLKTGFDPATGVLRIDPPIDPPVNEMAARRLLEKYDTMHVLDVALSSILNLSPEETKDLRRLTRPLGAAGVTAIYLALALPGGDKTRLTELVTETLRYRALFKSDVFLLKNEVLKANSLDFVRRHRDVFGLPVDPADQTITPPVILNVAAYVALATVTDAGFTTASGVADLDAIQRVITGVSAASTEDLAKTLRTDEARIASLKPHLIAFPPNAFEAVHALARCLAFADQIGVSGETLSLMNDSDDTFIALSRAAEDVFGAFRAKYPNAETFHEKMEPFEDKLRSRKRDALVDFILTKWPMDFADPNKLYEYFLIDVLQGGCARTSHVVAAISSLQLYVNRVLMHLEWSSDWDGRNNGVNARFTDSDKQAEWYWREHYRVWEANRRVFLYPENYIEPELRDDKTPLFKELEETLLQQEISDSNAHDAYAKYLTGFEEVAHLKIAGAYYDSGTYSDHRDDALHLFGVTQATPPVYYYRVINNTEATARLSAWQKLTLQIPVRKVSPIVFEGRLYIFWLETTTRALNTFVGGSSEFAGYRHAVRVKYSMLRTDGAWTPAQSLSFLNGGSIEESRTVDDPRFQTAPALPAQVNAARARVEELAAARRKASDGLELSRQAVRLAAEVLRRPLTFDEAALAALVSVGVVSAFVTTFSAVSATGTPPHLATAAAAAAALGVMVLSVPGSTVPRFQAAGVAYTDAFQVAQRKLALFDAIAGEQIATASLSSTSALLNAAQAELNRLLALRNVISVRWDESRRDHSTPLDDYKPEGWKWDRVYPDVYIPAGAPEAVIRLMLVPRNVPIPTVALQLLTCDEVDLTAGVLRQHSTDRTSSVSASRINNLHGQLQLVDRHSLTYGGQRFYLASFWLNHVSANGTFTAFAPPNSELQAVNGDLISVIIESSGQTVWMKKEGASTFLGSPLGTTLTPNLSNRFGHRGESGLLNAEFQKTLRELPSSISPIYGASDPATRNPFHPINPFLTYFRETFFHIPFLVANHLNSQQKFVEAQRWYHYIFNPTAADGNPWRYREFDDPMLGQSLREMLIDPLALTAYRADPFSPHAIARTRLSAYQKSIVMKYIDNLLDWGDNLFTQFTMESLNEATMLYVMAQEILGPRPRMLGSCGEGKVSPKTYEKIRPGLGTATDFLIELEVPRASSDRERSGRRREAAKLVSKGTRKSNQTRVTANGSEALALTTTNSFQPIIGELTSLPVGVGSSSVESGSESTQVDAQYWTSVGGTALKDLYAKPSGSGTSRLPTIGTEAWPPTIPGNKTGNVDLINPNSGFAGRELGVPGGPKIKPFDRIPPLDVKYGKRDIPLPGLATKEKVNPTVRQPQPIDFVPLKNTVFCIPPNKDLLGYWSRVEDRLFNIRNCMDITGVRRQPELFAPEIDPRLLVRMKAAGLTLDDVLNSISGNVPPYRFSYLIEKAKQYAGTLQSFGAQLLSALEKRDGEELANLRAVHEHNLLTMRTRMTKLEIDAAEDTIEGLRRQKTAVEFRQDHYRSLSDVGPIASEHTQQQHQRQASEFRTLAGVSQFIAAVLSIIPDAGAPTAMKFGGSQLGAAGRAAAEGLNAIAGFNEMAASMAGIESSNQRRDQEWKHQIATAKREISQIEKQITAAEIRKQIAVHALEVHQQTIDHSEEMFEFFRNEKFTNINLYRLLSNRLQGLYRQAFNSVLTMARMTEQAFNAERSDDGTSLSGNYWDAGSAGLLAGERLLIDLQSLEQHYIEKNYRQLEVEQSFSLGQFAPDQLVKLRLTGECEFSIPEWFFDLFYPGQYRRRLKAVRLTLPCVTGPYANVGATLRLVKSSIRLKPLERSTEPAQPIPASTPVPLRHTVSIATSKAQYDSGVFDLNFRDERYMPFEGAGAISTWQLSLPQPIRVFDYGTIGDVILHLSYTADYDETHKGELKTGANRLLALLTRPRSITREFSLRHEFPDVFHRLSTSPRDTEVSFAIEPRHFPFFLTGQTLRADEATLRVISSLNSLGDPAGRNGAGTTVLAIRRKEAAPPDFIEVRAPANAVYEVEGSGLRIFDFANVRPEDPTLASVTPALVGDYLIKFTAAGFLSPDLPGNGRGDIDPDKLHDIMIKIDYGLDLREA